MESKIQMEMEMEMWLGTSLEMKRLETGWPGESGEEVEQREEWRWMRRMERVC